MLRQNINLYKSFETPRPSGPFSTWKILWLSNLFVLFVFTIIYLFSLWNLHHLKTNKIKLMTESSAAEQAFIKLKNSYPPVFFTDNVAQSISEKQKSLDSQGKLFQTLTGTKDFSKTLVGLSQVIVPNAWLTNIAINKNGDEINLKGISIGMENIQLFLAKISADKNFSDFTATITSIENTDEKAVNRNLSFEMTIVKKIS